MLKKFLLLLLIISASLRFSIGQTVDSVTFKLNTRLSFYSFEKTFEMLLHVPQNLMYGSTEVSLKSGSTVIGEWKGMPGRRILRIPVELNSGPGTFRITADIKITGRSLRYLAETDLVILEYKPNEVKTDRLTGGLIVNRRPFFPFGFYCYSPVHPKLPEEEAVRGFNTMSPYQRILPETLPERKAYMDRCAELGMKVNYNILSVSGGGGVGSQLEGITPEEKRERLINEIITFRDHPALLAWYIADEPAGHRVAPEILGEVYRTIKEHDPWHPASIVFTAPFLSAKEYSAALDIVMADPYPVPDLPVSLVGNVTGQLSREFAGKKPVWIVPQAFGGGEWWGREPSLQEMRSMTYQAIIRGAKGIQYFVRQGLNYFPKSTAAWAECGRMAIEIAEMTPWLLSDEKTLPVSSASGDVMVSSFLHENQLLVLAVNRTNAPQRAGFSITGSISGKARVIFENRSVSVSGGYFSDQLSSFGSQAYLINLERPIETIRPFRENLTRDPGFEDLSSPGVPAACYARNGGDRGATYFTDTREKIEGNHSLRLRTPSDNRGVRLRFFPVEVMNGRRYMISVWAKTDPEQGIAGGRKEFEIVFGEDGRRVFQAENEWKQFVTIVTIPYDSQLPARTNLILQLKSAGVAWFDMLQVIECADIKQSVNPELKDEWYY